MTVWATTVHVIKCEMRLSEEQCVEAILTYEDSDVRWFMGLEAIGNYHSLK